MDQLKTALDWLKQNYFWLVSGVLAVIVLIVASTAANRLKKERISGESNIRSAVSTVKNVMSTKAEVNEASVQVHPNDKTITGMRAEVDEALQVAAQAWKIRRAAQQGLYQWPDVLGTHKKTFEKLPWPEFIPPPNYSRAGARKAATDTDTSKETEIPGISAQVLEVYGREIRKVLPDLAAIIGANWKYSTSDAAADASSTGGAGAKSNDDKTAKGGVQIKKYVVQWNPKDQDRWQEMVTTFRSVSIENRPTLIGAVYIQENLWLLESLFRIIKTVNGEADANDIAAIKSIDHIYFGRDAQGLSGELTDVNQRLIYEARAAKTERPGLKPPGATPKPPEAKESSSENLFDPADRRFVDDNYQPVDAATVRAAVQADKLGQSAALTVAKRIPFRIGFTMDERKVPAFLAACANTPFRFETRQVRINRHETSLTTGSEDQQASSLSAAASDLGTSAGAGAGGGSGDNAAPLSSSTRTNYDVRVEFYGFVKIYNPVNYEILETQPEELAADEPPVAAAATSDTPAGTNGTESGNTTVDSETN